MIKLKDLLSEAKFKKTYSSIKAMNKEHNRIWPMSGAPRVTVRSWSEVEKTGRQKVSYIEIEGDKEWIDAYKKIAFNGSGDKGDVIDYVRSLSEGINVEKFVKAIEKGKDVVVYDKKGKRYNLQGGNNKEVQVTDHWEDTGRRNVHPERTWQTLPLSKVKKIVVEGKLTEASSVPQKGDYIHDGRITYMEKILYIGKNYRGDKAGFIQGKEKGATYSYDFAYLKDTGKKKGGKTIWGIG